jgi:hypothetical protein
MRKTAIRLGLLLICMSFASGFGIAQSNASKTLQGRVLNNGGAALPNAIVYLQDGKTNSIRSFISTSDGSYRFGQLASDTDYQVWAQYKDAKSSKKTVSSYDSRKQVVIDLHINAK